MKFADPLICARLIRRYKRFLADVQLDDGRELTVHCPNPGRMLGLDESGYKCWISESRNKNRKLKHTLELVEAMGPSGKVLVGVNTNRPNELAREAIENGRIEALTGYGSIRREVPYGANSRIDLLLEEKGRRPCYVEIKNVHLVRRKNLHEFPDCKTARGAKHLNELAKEAQKGARAVMLYIIQRRDGNAFSLARDIDPDYYEAFMEARKAGVESYAAICAVSAREIAVAESVPIVL